MKYQKTIKVGITGGIGTGKSTVAKVFEILGIPVLYADSLAKKLMNTNDELKSKLISTFGSQIYINGVLQNKVLGNIVFNNPEMLSQLNQLVHPAVILYSNEWMQQQTSPYALKEAAIMIESNSYKDLDFIIGVTADLETRISRIQSRDQITKEEVLSRMNKQMDNDEKMKYCKYIIHNDDQHSLITQCLQIHQEILQLYTNQLS